MTNLDVNICCFAFWALLISPPYFKQFAEWVYQFRRATSHRAYDGSRAAISLFVGLFWPFYYLSQISDELSNPADVQAAPTWANAFVAIVALLFILLTGLRIRRLVLFVRAPRQRGR